MAMCEGEVRQSVEFILFFEWTINSEIRCML